jgi:prepilin-type N-terminal cleavage/methylation domain-containing protein
MKNTRGFTLVEVLIALVLLGIVGTSLYQLLVANQRLYRAQVQRVAVNESVRGAFTVIPTEIRELDAEDGDVLAMTANSLTYKSMQSLYFLCNPPDGVSLEIVLDRSVSYGLTAISAADDSVFIFAEGDNTTRSDDSWLSASVASTTAGTVCPGGEPSITVGLDGVAAGDLLAVQAGAPIRTFRAAQILFYADGAGDWWLGGRIYQKAAGTWSSTEAIVGPLSSSGLALTYADTAGNTAGAITDVGRIGVAVQSQSAELVYQASGAGSTYLLQDLVTQVALRNNPKY